MNFGLSFINPFIKVPALIAINSEIIITTKANQRTRELEAFQRGMSEIDKMFSKTTWSAINPVIHSLKELRKNTWDVERVDQAIEWLKDNFEVK